MVADQRGIDYDPAFLQVVSSQINDLLQSVIHVSSNPVTPQAARGPDPRFFPKYYPRD